MKRLALVFALLAAFLWTPLVLTLRKGFSWEGVRRLLDNHDLISSLNTSLVLAASSAALATLMGTLTAFALPRVSERWRQRFENLLFLPLLLPEIALGLALLVWFVKLGVDFGWGTLVAGHVGFCFTYATLVSKAWTEASSTLLEIWGHHNEPYFATLFFPNFFPGSLLLMPPALPSRWTISLSAFLLKAWTR